MHTTYDWKHPTTSQLVMPHSNMPNISVYIRSNTHIVSSRTQYPHNINVIDTGSGKTDAFVNPMLAYISRLPPITEDNENMDILMRSRPPPVSLHSKLRKRL